MPSAGAAAAPPPPPAPPRVERNCTLSRTTLILLRFWPLVLSSHWSSFSRPSTIARLPLVRYLETSSPCLPQASMSTNVVSSRVAPDRSEERRVGKEDR